jgi:hypothetical protein
MVEFAADDHALFRTVAETVFNYYMNADTACLIVRTGDVKLPGCIGIALLYRRRLHDLLYNFQVFSIVPGQNLTEEAQMLRRTLL